MTTAQTFNFTTGPATLPDVGKLNYNGCTFGPLFETNVSGKVVRDEANRTTKLVEYSISVDGYVTLPAGAGSVAPTMATLRKLLTAQGGALIYQGRGLDLTVSTFAGGGSGVPILSTSVLLSDVAWGPVPELLEFQPLGGGRSAKVRWRVTVRVPEVAKGGLGLLQLNYETVVSYNEDYFSTLSVRGTLEIPLTRLIQQSRVVSRTVDDFRQVLEARILRGIDLSRFRVVRREFPVSRDKRTMDWEVVVEEKPYMDLPPDCPIARGTYSVRPAKVGMGLVTWLCTLKATYTVRAGIKRREAWWAFLALLRLRMNYSVLADVPELDKDQAPSRPGVLKTLARGLTFGIGGLIYDALLKTPTPADGVSNPKRRVWLLDFQIDEGLYLDSKTVSFSATWRLLSKFSTILLASGVWRKLPDQDSTGNNLWAITMADVSGTQSWLTNRLDAALDVIVDFGGPDQLGL